MASSTRVFANKCRALMAAAKSSAAAAAATPARTNGLQKVHTVSPALAKFLGSSEASRAVATKKIWEYVISNNLQNPLDKREIYCDDKLKAIFEDNEKVDFTSVAKLLSIHFPKSKK